MLVKISEISNSDKSESSDAAKSSSRVACWPVTKYRSDMDYEASDVKKMTEEQI